ncbi:Uu.00g119430.m01.CDS01 [Anthostomella pinea]|uniref:Uu.00g119430.m01.CDS01 n=1 Tax=Anthostomella pinea TaxID=933095 RepID=A0AAI8VGJ0_9PEZI|nr:Uu.00g119430.m01.CDS01 [Anthostomella pinea]
MPPRYVGFTLQQAQMTAGKPPDGSEYGFKKFSDGEPPVDFFTHAPTNFPAVFSTKNGTKTFRMVTNPTIERQGEYWHASKIQLVCDELRTQMPGECKYVEYLRGGYYDLYHYFDARDIYERGAQNLWNVMNHMAYENLWMNRELLQDAKVEFEKWAAELLLNNKSACEKLRQWNPKHHPDVLGIFTFSELDEIDGMDSFYMPSIREIFLRHHANLKRGLPIVALSPLPVNTEASHAPSDQQLVLYRNPAESAGSASTGSDIETGSKVVNGIVIVDGTSATAARVHANKSPQSGLPKPSDPITRHQDAVPSEQPQNADAAQQQQVQSVKEILLAPQPAMPQNPPESTLPSNAPDIGDAATRALSDGMLRPDRMRVNSAPPTGQRFVSGPGFGSVVTADSLKGSTSDANEARVYPGNEHDVGEVLKGCIKPGDRSPVTVEQVLSASTAVVPTEDEQRSSTVPAITADQPAPPVLAVPSIQQPPVTHPAPVQAAPTAGFDTSDQAIVPRRIHVPAYYDQPNIRKQITANLTQSGAHNHTPGYRHGPPSGYPAQMPPQGMQPAQYNPAFANQLPPFPPHPPHLLNPMPNQSCGPSGVTSYPPPIYPMPNAIKPGNGPVYAIPGTQGSSLFSPPQQHGMSRGHNAGSSMGNPLEIRPIRAHSGARNGNGTMGGNNSRWEYVDDGIHGPRSIFRNRKDSTPSKKSAQKPLHNGNGKGNHWQRKDSSSSNRRPSFGGNGYNHGQNNGQRRTSGGRPPQSGNAGNWNQFQDPSLMPSAIPPAGVPYHQENIHYHQENAARQHVRGASSTECLNAKRDFYEQCSQCPCTRCQDNDRTIHVKNLNAGLSNSEDGRERIEKWFSQYGCVDRVQQGSAKGVTGGAAFVRFATVANAHGAVKAANNLRAAALAPDVLSVNYSIGSQYWRPYGKDRQGSYHQQDGQNRPSQRAPYGVQGVAHPSLALPHMPSPVHPGMIPTPIPEEISAFPGPPALPIHPQNVNQAVAGVAPRQELLISPTRGPHQTAPEVMESKPSSDSVVAGPVATFPQTNITPLKHDPRLRSDDTDGSPSVAVSSDESNRSEAKTPDASADLIRKIETLTGEMSTSRLGSRQGSPTSDESTRVMTPSQDSSSKKASPLSGQDGGKAPVAFSALRKLAASAKFGKDDEIDLGTVRIRPGRAKWVPEGFGDDMPIADPIVRDFAEHLEGNPIQGQSSTQPEVETPQGPNNEGQQALATSQDHKGKGEQKEKKTADQPTKVNEEPVYLLPLTYQPLETEVKASQQTIEASTDQPKKHSVQPTSAAQIRLTREPSPPAKRKVDEVDQTTGGASERSSPKKKPKQNSNKGEPNQRKPTSQQDPRHGQQQQHGGSAYPKTNKKGKNKKRQDTAAQNPLLVPGSNTEAVPAYSSASFKPDLASSALPSYPQEQQQAQTGLPTPRIGAPPEGSSRQMSEAFPAYHDPMSGPHNKGKDQKGQGKKGCKQMPNPTNASTVVQKQVPSPQKKLDPRANEFVDTSQSGKTPSPQKKLDPRANEFVNTSQGGKRDGSKTPAEKANDSNKGPAKKLPQQSSKGNLKGAAPNQGAKGKGKQVQKGKSEQDGQSRGNTAAKVEAKEKAPVPVDQQQSSETKRSNTPVGQRESKPNQTNKKGGFKGNDVVAPEKKAHEAHTQKPQTSADQQQPSETKKTDTPADQKESKPSQANKKGGFKGNDVVAAEKVHEVHVQKPQASVDQQPPSETKRANTPVNQQQSSETKKNETPVDQKESKPSQANKKGAFKGKDVVATEKKVQETQVQKPQASIVQQQASEIKRSNTPVDQKKGKGKDVVAPEKKAHEAHAQKPQASANQQRPSETKRSNTLVDQKNAKPDQPLKKAKGNDTAAPEKKTTEAPAEKSSAGTKDEADNDGWQTSGKPKNKQKTGPASKKGGGGGAPPPKDNNAKADVPKPALPKGKQQQKSQQQAQTQPQRKQAAVTKPRGSTMPTLNDSDFPSLPISPPSAQLRESRTISSAWNNVGSSSSKMGGPEPEKKGGQMAASSPAKDKGEERPPDGERKGG